MDVTRLGRFLRSGLLGSGGAGMGILQLESSSMGMVVLEIIQEAGSTDGLL